MADPQLALDLLMTDDPSRPSGSSMALDECNRLRQQVEADLAEAALALAERTFHGERGLVLAGEGWHEGVKGIVASRLTNLFRVPSILFAVEDGVARGSGRSVGTVDLFRALEACSDLLTRFGGHAAAVGCTLPAQDVDEFRARFLALSRHPPAEQFASATTVDAEVDLEDVSVELGAEFALLEPFGHGNRTPAAREPRRLHERSLEGRQDRQPSTLLGIRRSRVGARDRVPVRRHRRAGRA